MGARVRHEGAFLAGHGEYPAGVEVTCLRGADQAIAVCHGKADVQVVPVLRLADGANRREIPLHLVSQLCLGDQFVAAEQAADVVPLAAPVDDLAPCVKLHCAADAGRVAHLLHHPRGDRQRLVIESVGCLNAIGGQKTVEVALRRHRLVELRCFLALGLGELQAACLPVAPAAAAGQLLGKALGQRMGFVPATQAQQQPGAPLADRVVAQLRIVVRHHLQCAGIGTLGEGQADLPGDRDFLVIGKRHPSGVALQQPERLLGVLAGESAQANGNDIAHGRSGGREARGVAQHLRLLGDVDQQFALGLQCGQVLRQEAGQPVIAAFDGKLGPLPAQLFAELARCRPALEQRITGLMLGFTDQPEALGGGVALLRIAVFQLIAAEQTVQLGEIHGRIVVLDEGLPVAPGSQQAQPAQLHPAGLGQIAVFGEKFLHLGVAGGLEPCRQVVVSQIGLEWVIAQRIGISAIGAAVATGQRLLGFVIVLTLLGEAGGLGGLDGKGSEQEAETDTGESTAHETSENGRQGNSAASLARPIGQLNEDSRLETNKANLPTSVASAGRRAPEEAALTIVKRVSDRAG